MKKFLPTFLILILSAILFLVDGQKSLGISLNTNKIDHVTLKNKKIILSVADTEKKIEQGLMFVDKITENEGMIFLFKVPDYKIFWMKNMKIPLDILFIYNNKIVKIYKEVPECKNYPCETYESKYKVDSVLELKSGFCKKFNVKAGDKVKFSRDINIKQAKLKEGADYEKYVFNKK